MRLEKVLLHGLRQSSGVSKIAHRACRLGDILAALFMARREGGIVTRSGRPAVAKALWRGRRVARFGFSASADYGGILDFGVWFGLSCVARLLPSYAGWHDVEAGTGLPLTAFVCLSCTRAARCTRTQKVNSSEGPRTRPCPVNEKSLSRRRGFFV